METKTIDENTMEYIEALEYLEDIDEECNQFRMGGINETN